MSASLSVLRSITRDEMKVDKNGKIWSNSSMDRLLKISHRKIQKDLDWAFPANEPLSLLEIPTDGSLEYDLIVHKVAVVQLVKVNNIRVSPLSRKRRELMGSNLTNSGQPSRYYLRGGSIGFNTVPSSGSVISILHLLKVDPPTEDAGSLLPDTDEVNQIIALYTKYLAWKQIKGQDATADQALAEYRQQMNEVRQEFWPLDEDLKFNTDRNTGSFSGRNDWCSVG